MHGDMYFVLRSTMTPLECRSGGQTKDCDNAEVVSKDLIVRELNLEVDSRFTQYSLCNVCVNGSDNHGSKQFPISFSRRRLLTKTKEGAAAHRQSLPGRHVHVHMPVLRRRRVQRIHRGEGVQPHGRPQLLQPRAQLVLLARQDRHEDGRRDVVLHAGERPVQQHGVVVYGPLL